MGRTALSSTDCKGAIYSQGDCHKMNRRVLGYGKSHKHKNCYPTANTNHTGFIARTLQLALSEGAESFPNIKCHTLGTRSRVPQLLLGKRNQGYGVWETAAIRDFRLSTNQNIKIQSSHTQLIQIGMKTTNIGMENPYPLGRTWTRIGLYIATKNQQKMQPMGKIKEEINFHNTHTKIRIDGRKEVYLSELPYLVRLNNPLVLLGPGRR